MVSSRSLIIFSYNLENNSFTTFSWRKDRLDNGRGIRNWKEIYLLYRGWYGTPLYIWQGRSVKVFEGRKKKGCSKNVKSTYLRLKRTNILSAFCEYFSPLLTSVLYHHVCCIVLESDIFHDYPWNSWYFAFGTFVSELA